MLLPVPAGLPPHEPVNHSTAAPVPAKPPVKVKVVLLPKQILMMPVMLVGAIESVLIIMSCEAQVVALQMPS
jgi:hypothetical protein